MEISQVGLAVFCLASFACGLLLGIFYDISAILPAVGGKTFLPPLRKKLSEIKLPLIKTETKSVKGNARDFTVGFSVFLHDLAFMIFAGIVTTLTVYRFNYGKWRFYALWLIVFGFALYRRFLRIPILALAEIIRFIIKIIAVYAICFIMAPIKAILRKAKDFYRMLKIKKMQTNIIKYSKKEKMRMLSMIKDRGPFAEK